MIQKTGYFIFLFFIATTLVFVKDSVAQKHYTKSPHVVYEVTSDEENYTIQYTFKDHYNNLQHYTLELPAGYTNSEIDVFGVPQWLFEPYIDNEYNRTIRMKELAEGLFMLSGKMIEVDKSAVISRYAETFCKPIAELIVRSLEEYGRDTRRDRIEFAIRFVQDIPYGIPAYSDKQRHFGGVSPPPGVLLNGYGDCDSKVLLFAGILIYLIPADEFIFLNQAEHVLSAVKEKPTEGLTFVRFEDDEYLIAETAGPGKRFLGEPGEFYSNKFKVEKLKIAAPGIFPYKTPVSSRLPYEPDLPAGKNYIVIQNTSDKDFSFQISLDKSNWKEFTVHRNDFENYKFDKEMEVYLRIKEKSAVPMVYKIQTGNAYSFSFNDRKKVWEGN
jgi:hypothetical protein